MRELNIVKIGLGSLGIIMFLGFLGFVIYAISTGEFESWNNAGADARLIFLGLIFAGLLSNK